MALHAVIIADVVGSRRLKEFSLRRDALLSELNCQHRERGWIRHDYAVTSWDEFQGLLLSPSFVPEVVWSLWKTFHPLVLRLGVGVGRVDPGSGSKSSLSINRSLNGEAFYMARDALKEVSSSSHGTTRQLVCVRAACGSMELACNSVLRLADALVQGVTERQWELIKCYERYSRQSAVANELGVAASTVSRGLASARYWEVKRSLHELACMMSEWHASPRES